MRVKAAYQKKRTDGEFLIVMSPGLHIHFLNESAAFLLDLCDGRSLGTDEILERFAQRYREVAEETLKEDIRQTVQEFLQAGILVTEDVDGGGDDRDRGQ